MREALTQPQDPVNESQYRLGGEGHENTAKDKSTGDPNEFIEDGKSGNSDRETKLPGSGDASIAVLPSV